MADIVNRLRANAAYWRSEHSDIAEDLRRLLDRHLPDWRERIPPLTPQPPIQPRIQQSRNAGG
jgi:hypothetical protein